VKTVTSVKRLEGWMTFAEAGEILGLQKQGVHRAVFDSSFTSFNVDDDVRGVGEKPIMLVREEAVWAEKARRDQVAAEREARQDDEATAGRQAAIPTQTDVNNASS